jgi:hypothetical protein
MRLAQFVDENGKRALAVTARGESRMVKGARSTLDLARQAIAEEVSLRKLIADSGVGKPVDLRRALKERRVLPPIDHKDPAHVFVTGTGLTHLGSAEGRDQMHRDLADPAKLTDSMRMFRLGLDGGKPGRGETGAQPEWFYKGDGSILVAPEGDLKSPSFALDGGEEPEIVGVYVIDHASRPVRIGFALGNEFSDHVTERQNYLWLAHSKLRPASVGPELLVGDLPADVQGVSRIRRGREVIWEKPFLSGEQNMAHSIANLEAHHFKYALFRRPGDVHVHFFGTATLSFSANVQTQKGDVFEIESEPFGLPLKPTDRLAAATRRCGSCCEARRPVTGRGATAGLTRRRCWRGRAATIRCDADGRSSAAGAISGTGAAKTTRLVLGDRRRFRRVSAGWAPQMNVRPATARSRRPAFQARAIAASRRPARRPRPTSNRSPALRALSHEPTRPSRSPRHRLRRAVRQILRRSSATRIGCARYASVSTGDPGRLRLAALFG